MAAAGLITANWRDETNEPCDYPQAVSDERLVAGAKQGSRAAFDHLYKRHGEKIFRVVHRITRNREDAEDAVQECFLNAFIHIASFDGKSRFSTWVTRIAINAALMKLRKNRTCREVPMEESVETSKPRPEQRLIDPAPNPEERYAKNEREGILRDAIARLRPAIRTAVEIQLQDCSLNETAEMLGISFPAAKGRLFHARAALRRASQLQFVVPRIWTNPPSSSDVARQMIRQRAGRRERERSYFQQQASFQASGACLGEMQS
jgi:RNA polymerase sigma factor (sigma-70 family)